MLVICNNLFDDRCLFFTFLAYKKSGQNVVAPLCQFFRSYNILTSSVTSVIHY